MPSSEAGTLREPREAKCLPQRYTASQQPHLNQNLCWSSGASAASLPPASLKVSIQCVGLRDSGSEGVQVRWVRHSQGL